MVFIEERRERGSTKNHGLGPVWPRSDDLCWQMGGL